MAESVDHPVFQSLSADDVDPTVTEVESCCMNCYKNVSLFSINIDFRFELFFLMKLNTNFGTGNHSDAINTNSIL